MRCYEWTVGQVSEFSAATIERYHADGSWDADTIADLVARNAVATPEAVAFHAPEGTLTWREYDAAATRLAGAYVLAGLPPERPLAVLLTGARSRTSRTWPRSGRGWSRWGSAPGG